MAEGERHGLVDLEKELTCSICTDLLYQPLTLLDCLHTFCGACLKEWFQFQASTATSLHPYTCPSCRASVRGTKPNATVTTLLDMYVQANPSRGKSEEEKDSDRKKYKPGENVLPKLRRREEPGAEEDRRLMEEVQQLSLREVGISGNNNSGSLEPPRERRRRERSRERSRDSRTGEARRSRASSREPAQVPSSSARVVPQRAVEHQSSLRSLLSASELDSQDVEEEIMRQIMEEGLLDGIDLNNIDVAQEDEISERIADAYRRRQRERQRERQERRDRLAREGRTGSDLSSPPATRQTRSESRPDTTRSDEPARRRPHARTESGTSTPRNQQFTHPPVSRPALIDAANFSTRATSSRPSSQGSSRSSRRAPPPANLSVTSSRQGARSASDLIDRPSTSEHREERRRRLSENQRSSIDIERQHFRNNINFRPSSNPSSPGRAVSQVSSESPSNTPAGASTPVPAHPPSASRRTTDPTHIRQIRTNSTGQVPGSPALGPARSTTEPPTSRSTASSAVAPPTLYPEPNISCNRCAKEHIEYKLHYNCSRCDGSNYNICLDCYRQGKGCKYWYGFGWEAWRQYERQAPPGGYPPNHEHPHILVGHRFRRPSRPLQLEQQPSGSVPVANMTEEDPAKRLDVGVFCDMCHEFANACYWKCDLCNEGAWGFCNECVNQGRHCTHPLLPIAHKTSSFAKSPKLGDTIDTNTSAPTSPKADTSHHAAPLSPGLAPPDRERTPPLTPKSASLIRGPGIITIANAIFRPLTFTTICNICTYPIPPSHTRFHCPKCNHGDYDICTSCYHKLVSQGRINHENGPNGWRKCIRGHRMVLVGFEDRDGGQRRVVTRDLVGGLRLRDEDAQNPISPSSTTAVVNRDWSWEESGTRQTRTPLGEPLFTATRFPPDGGIGFKVTANWGYFPVEGVKDELMFPKYAEIREAEDINGDWFFGVYAGEKGLFPGNYGVVGR